MVEIQAIEEALHLAYVNGVKWISLAMLRLLSGQYWRTNIFFLEKFMLVSGPDLKEGGHRRNFKKSKYYEPCTHFYKAKLYLS